jgi:hypothetical protein
MKLFPFVMPAQHPVMLKLSNAASCTGTESDVMGDLANDTVFIESYIQ